MDFSTGTEVKVLSGPRAGTIATVVAHKGRSLVLRVRGHKDTLTVRASNVTVYTAPMWPKEGWDSWLP